MASTETLLAEYAGLRRAIIAKRGDVYANVDQVISYACADLLNMSKGCGDPMGLLIAEVEFERECLERLAA